MKALVIFLFLSPCPAAAADIPAWGSLPAEPAARAEALRAAAELVLASSGEPMSAASDCAAFTQLWLEKLNAANGYRLIYAETAGMGEVALAGGGTARRDKTHYFLADRTACGSAEPCDGEIILDPTYMQFIEQGECLYSQARTGCAGAWTLLALPKVLVGTRAEIAAFYAGLAGRVRLYTDGTDLHAGHYDGASAASLIYSFGANSGLRANIGIFFGAGKPAPETGI